MRYVAQIWIAALTIALSGSHARAALLGPTAYLSQADSPFALGTGTFCLETFEDGLFDVPGVTGNGTVIGPGGLTDSVDGDDGMIDGSGTNGHSYFSIDGSGGITFTFDPSGPLGLPTAAGAVWTDGGFGADVTFEAFDQNGVSLGTVIAMALGDGSNSGTTAEDRFFGATNAGGISAIKLSNPGGGIEVDHLQFNDCAAAVSTTTSTTSTTSTPSSTLAATTTTLASGCANVPSGPTFASIACRLDALLAAVQAESRLGSVESQLARALQTAKNRTTDAESKCDANDAKHARSRLAQGGENLRKFTHRLQATGTRRKVPADVRKPLATTAGGIRSDVIKLRTALQCPHA